MNEVNLEITLPSAEDLVKVITEHQISFDGHTDPNEAMGGPVADHYTCECGHKMAFEIGTDRPDPIHLHWVDRMMAVAQEHVDAQLAVARAMEEEASADRDLRQFAAHTAAQALRHSTASPLVQEINLISIAERIESYVKEGKK